MLIALAAPVALQAAVPDSGVTLSAQQFAMEPGWKSRVDLNAQWESSSKVTESKTRAVREVWFQSFFESGTAGDRSFEFDVAVLRLQTGEHSHLWFGRTHPWLEDGSGKRRAMPSTTGAVGANWGQNQARALEPRVVGWIGAGWSGAIGHGVSATALMSPVFLPSFGPRLDFSEYSEANGSRFAKLPPAHLMNNGQAIPVRYKIDSGDLAKIVLQHQVYLSTTLDAEDFGVRLFGWSAPVPSARIEATGKLRVNSDLDELNALVTATPSFPRETTLGLQWELGTKRFFDFQFAYQTESGRLNFSGEIRPFRWFRAGALHLVETRPAPAAEASPVPAAPGYGDSLLWTEFNEKFAGDRLQSLLRIEQHVLSGRGGLWIQPELRYSADGRLGFFAAVSLIAGQDGSYFGQWRSLDSVGTGVSYQW
ncbi:MAG: hypothetical protein A2X94_13625 [Bdellovibrionales bacterium GWB1_55_8]|nr:MAG: hypothetical protein A2X94_13625 [Bdellovibrionales bacterium GWB1_55_8]